MRRTNEPYFLFLLFLSGEGGLGPKQREPASDREVLPSATSEHVDAVGTSGTADPPERDRADSAPSDVQLFESHPPVG